jgi:hypothetical protein
MVGLKPTCDEAFRSDAFNRTHAKARRRNPQPNFNVEPLAFVGGSKVRLLVPTTNCTQCSRLVRLPHHRAIRCATVMMRSPGPDGFQTCDSGQNEKRNHDVHGKTSLETVRETLQLRLEARSDIAIPNHRPRIRER